MTQLKVGDIVQLLSGGPKMTVSQISANNIGCEYFNAKGNNKTRSFRPEVLALVQAHPYR